jgi:DNA polymerase III epsilon subunit-like protein
MTIDANKVPPIIDLEASGFGRGSYPIEVGFALENRDIHSFLIKPEDDWTHWSEEAEQIHGISRERLLAEGMSIEDIALKLNEMLRGQTLYSDAWSFDSSWIGRLFDSAGIVQRFRIETINKLLKPNQVEFWHPTKEAVLQELGLKAHRAAIDVQVLQETYLRISQRS